MGKIKTKFTCKECGHETVKWLGKCPGCHQWNTMEEDNYFTGVDSSKKNGQPVKQRKAINLNDAEDILYEGFSSGMGEFDRVLGGQITKGSLTLISGDPGQGKSTLLSQISDNVAEKYGPVLYVSGEESEGQLRKRFKGRMKLSGKNILALHTESVLDLEDAVEEHKPVLLIVDSIQTIYDPSSNGDMGSVSQVKGCTARLMKISKTLGITTFVVGQVTKEKGIAGPKNLEHMVDTVIYLEGDKYNDLRLLRCNKNRFGSDSELGVFQMREEGMVEVPNPSEFLLDDRMEGASGSAVICISDTRPLLIEVQALATNQIVQNAFPKRTSVGFQRDSLGIITAVLENKCSLTDLSYKDIYVKITGGMKVSEPSADLGVAMSLYSTSKNKPIDSKTVILGEVGLVGEVRPVGKVESLVTEIERVGFSTCILPTKDYERVKGKVENIKLIPVRTVHDSIKALFG